MHAGNKPVTDVDVEQTVRVSCQQAPAAVAASLQTGVILDVPTDVVLTNTL